MAQGYWSCPCIALAPIFLVSTGQRLPVDTQATNKDFGRQRKVWAFGPRNLGLVLEDELAHKGQG